MEETKEDETTGEQAPPEDLTSLVPKRRSNSPLAILALGAIGLVGGIAWFLTVSGGNDASHEDSTAPEAVQAPPQDEPAAHDPAAPAPPPPPPPDDSAGVETQSSAAPTSADPAVASGAQAAPAAKGPCDEPCNGKPASGFSDALRRRGQLARSCYDAALRQDSTLSGKLAVRVRIAPSGAVCSAKITQDQIGSAVINTCILSKFRSAGYPAPTGGCVDGQVPLNFVGKP